MRHSIQGFVETLMSSPVKTDSSFLFFNYLHRGPCMFHLNVCKVLRFSASAVNASVCLMEALKDVERCFKRCLLWMRKEI